MSQEIRYILAENIKYLRNSKGLKREELSLLLGFDNSYISKLENGSINITLDKLETISSYFGIQPYQLLQNNYKD